MTKPSRVKKGAIPRLATGLPCAGEANVIGRPVTSTLPESAVDAAGTKAATDVSCGLAASVDVLLVFMLLGSVASFIRQERGVVRLACRYGRVFLLFWRAL